ncbi:hypothetical protein EVAR_64708_1 [Eumeta japonica]|uniref:Uncharacterized protein n=1 Tax=Eumeta variegata TaxID=151549 RepID=A0A4C1ZP09_EUMVA|nr:hypothetical protein EVAR_64708_1 [Eumeta japonica]
MAIISRCSLSCSFFLHTIIKILFLLVHLALAYRFEHVVGDRDRAKFVDNPPTPRDFARPHRPRRFGAGVVLTLYVRLADASDHHFEHENISHCAPQLRLQTTRLAQFCDAAIDLTQQYNARNPDTLNCPRRHAIVACHVHVTNTKPRARAMQLPWKVNDRAQRELARETQQHARSSGRNGTVLRQRTWKGAA